MNILKQNKEKINRILETFDRMIINGYSLNLCNYRHFLFYLIQNNIKLVDFNKFALTQAKQLYNHIDDYIKSNKCECIYLNSGKMNKDKIARSKFEEDANKTDSICALSTVEICNTMTLNLITKQKN